MVKSSDRSEQVRAGRRSFLRRFGAATLGVAAARTALAEDGQRRLSFMHTHTAERLTVMYYEAGAYLPNVLQKVNVLLRDFRTETVFQIDPRVLDRLFMLQAATGGSEAFQVISGYRSPDTNAALRRDSIGVAEHSLHMEGRAIDVRLPGFASDQLAALAQAQAAGGVGFYRPSDFVHLDTGRVRIWGDSLQT